MLAPVAAVLWAAAIFSVLHLGSLRSQTTSVMNASGEGLLDPLQSAGVNCSRLLDAGVEGKDSDEGRVIKAAVNFCAQFGEKHSVTVKSFPSCVSRISSAITNACLRSKTNTSTQEVVQAPAALFYSNDFILNQSSNEAVEEFDESNVSVNSTETSKPTSTENTVCPV
jgi:hypothetical protein